MATRLVSAGAARRRSWDGRVTCSGSILACGESNSVSARQRAGETAVPAVLLGRLADGDRDAFAEFYRVTSSRVYGMVLRVLRDPGYAEETVQEVYLQVW